MDLGLRGPCYREGYQDDGQTLNWVLVRGFNLSCHNKETMLCTIDPQYGNLKKSLNKNPVIPT